MPPANNLGSKTLVGIFLTLVSTAVIRGLWPEVKLPIALGSGGLLVGGLALWWHHRKDQGAYSNLGAALVAGMLAAVAVFAVQSDRDAQRQAAEERQTIQLMLGMQRDLTGINLSGRDLTNFYLHEKILVGANLKGANLTNAYLVGAHLNNAYLNRAILKGADPRWSILAGADFRGADLAGAKLAKARANGDTRWPRGFDWRAAGVRSS